LHYKGRKGRRETEKCKREQENKRISKTSDKFYDAKDK
jgi:hypothetical protein